RLEPGPQLRRAGATELHFRSFGGHPMKSKLTITALLVGSALAGTQAFAADFAGDAKDAWSTGKLEAGYALTTPFGAIALTTQTTGGKVHLTGNVESSIDRDLAGELAKGIDGVVSVDNDLTVVADARKAPPPKSTATATANAKAPERPFGVWVDDATT